MKLFLFFFSNNGFVFSAAFSESDQRQRGRILPVVQQGAGRQVSKVRGWRVRRAPTVTVVTVIVVEITPGAVQVLLETVRAEVQTFSLTSPKGLYGTDSCYRRRRGTFPTSDPM